MTNLRIAPAPQVISLVTTRTWLEHIIRQGLQDTVMPQWGQKPDNLGSYSESRLYSNAFISVRMSFYRQLNDTVLRDIFIGGGTLDNHRPFLQSLKEGTFPIQIVGNLGDQQRNDLTSVIYALGHTCVTALESMKLPTLQAKQTKGVLPAKSPTASTPPEPAPLQASLSPYDQQCLIQLKDRIDAAIKGANADKVKLIIEKLQDKSMALHDDIQALESESAGVTSTQTLLLKQQHRSVIIDGLMQAKAHARALLRATKPAPIAPQHERSPQVSATPTAKPPVTAAEPQPFARPTSLWQRALTTIGEKIRNHPVLTTAGLGGIAAGIALVFNMAGSPASSVAMPTINPGQPITKVTKGVVAAPVAAPAAASAVAKSFVAASPTGTGEMPATAIKPDAAHDSAPTPLKHVANDAYTPLAKKTLTTQTAKPAVISGVVFKRTSFETILNMCGKGFKTWACENQPA